MAKEIVICPKCGGEIKTQGNIFFRHCGRAWIIKECLTEFNNKVYNNGKTLRTKKHLNPDVNNDMEEIGIQ